mmetsp:Transcript_23819/g.36817  ORF Transcript_23819/g.36817 Transcript_23819/m.36817 type:complete len:362 (+) Transcript_23819:25-1110(+)|eukprot:CAMPEP_0195301294 /NCGR_PEP_ID=MMETSP0707-20130614/29031_1 /TAXON_ID=33640 /ORGANISM="Asterionellopsis glacialis, Strain CCMP134" /LENGTH=361 /DNA_ID=CAMNT_0040364195 /DNA_START=12 /DNA_END=1097 /DNA_ORIENTATION=-
MRLGLFCLMIVIGNLKVSSAFSPMGNVSANKKDSRLMNEGGDNNGNLFDCELDRRSLLAQSTAAIVGMSSLPKISNAAVGSLPEFADTNAIVQGITLNVADKSQQDAMVKFLEDAFDFKILRQIKAGPNSDTWMGFGPEELSIPSNFEIPVSSFAEYGGHASIHIRYDAQDSNVYYKNGDNAPGDNIAFLQIGVPTYRVSQMVKNGGNVLDAYGYVNVVSPCGFPMRSIVGISPDPIMMVAINCQDVQRSRAFYEKLGFVEQEYPYARPSKGTGQFEPPQPPQSVYLAPSPNCMGVLLLQSKNKRKGVTPNPVVRSLNIVYKPSEDTTASEDEIFFSDPSGIGISLQTVEQFEKEQSITKA